MSTNQFFKLILKYKWILIAIPLVTLLVTFLCIKDIPKEYKSQAKLSTGLLDPSRQVGQANVYYSGADLTIKTNQQFTNIMDIMMMPKNMSILSYQLILHDLKNPKASFRDFSDEINALNAAKRNEIIGVFEERLATKQVLTSFNDDKHNLYKLVVSMGYDEKSLKRKLGIFHEENSDFINIEFTSENTLLSVFVVNTLATDFIANYGLDQLENKNKSIRVLDSLLKKKEAVMIAKNQELKDYKIKNRILNLDKQSQIAYQQIVDLDNKKSQALVELQALQSALNNINTQLNNRKQDKLLGVETIQDNQAIVAIRAKLRAAENAYIDGGFLAKDKRKIDSLQDVLNTQLANTSDNYVNDPLIAKQSLIQRRIALSIDLDKTKAGIRDINNELARLNANFSTMVPFDAGVQNYERNADVATKEYLELLNKYNQSNLDKNIGLRLQLEQEGVAGAPEPSKSVFYLALSLLASLVICFALLFVLGLLDKSVNDENELSALNVGKVMGRLSAVKVNEQDVNVLWNKDKLDHEALKFKNSLRSLRFDVNKALSDQKFKVLGLTNLSASHEVFAMSGLVYAFAKLEKKILLIGNADLAAEVRKWGIPTNQSFKAVLDNSALISHQNITFLNNDFNDLSLLESTNNEKILAVFNDFKTSFDLVIVQLGAIDGLSDVKEWISFTEKFVGFITAGDVVTASAQNQLRSLTQSEKFLGWIINEVK